MEETDRLKETLPAAAAKPPPTCADDMAQARQQLLSGTLKTHPVGWLTVAGIETLDPARFAVICLAQNAAPTDPIARRYRAASQDWVDIDALDATNDLLDRTPLVIDRDHY